MSKPPNENFDDVLLNQLHEYYQRRDDDTNYIPISSFKLYVSRLLRD